MRPASPTTPRILRRWLAAAPLLAVLLANGSTGAASSYSVEPSRPAPAETDWAQVVTDLVAGELEAGRQGVAHALAFAAEDVELDDRAWSGKVLRGRAQVTDHLLQRFGFTMDEVSLQGVHVDQRGALVQLRYAAAPGFSGAVDVLQVREYGTDGIRSMRNLVSVGTLLSRPAALVAPFDATLAIAASYAATIPGSPEVALVPGTDTPAVYLDDRLPQLAGTIVVVLDSEPGTCPHTTAFELKVEGGRVREARRLRAPGHGCDLPSTGWWSEPASPEPADGHPRRVRLGAGGDVELRGASEGFERLLRWGVDRFGAAGLELPALATVTFSAATGRCAGVGGRAHLDEDGVDLLLCFQEAKVCRDATCTAPTLGARMTLLHELAHAWLYAHLSEEAVQAYLDRTGTQAWSDAHLAWEERGVERAAETVMWGLLDQHIPLPRVGDPSCEELAGDFLHLTGAAALRDCSAPGPASARADAPG
jgi:hypothetical protein